MFYLYHHHDHALLANLLMALRRSEVTSPLEPDVVLVPNPGSGRWLKMQLAEREGIAANIATELPAPFFWQILASSLPGERPDSSAYRREYLRWHLYALLPELAAAIPRLSGYLAGEAQPLRRWQLAERLADLFDEYLIYRRDMLLDWEHDRGTTRPPADWQAPLWRALVARLGPHHRARLLGELVQRIAAGEPVDTRLWPARLYCFALGNLPPDYLRLLYAIGHHCDVHFLMLNPSDGYWGDIEKRPLALAAALDGAPLPGEQQVFDGHPLLASLGFAGRDFLRIIYSDEFAGIRELELGAALAYQPPGAATLLHRLQSGVICMEATDCTAGLARGDRSFQVHACHGVLREVQVLHDQLLDLLAADPTLEPRDIIVLTPDMGRFAAAIEAVFGAAAGAAAIPFNLSDQPRRTSHPIVLTFRALLDLPLWRWTTSELLALLAVPAIMRRWHLEEADLANLQRWVQAAGIRWGLDAGHRAENGAGRWAENSWRFGLDRLLAGVAFAEPDQLTGGVAPMVDLEGGATAALGQLWLLIERLCYWREALPEAASGAEWQERLNALCVDLFSADPEDRDEQLALQTVAGAVATLDAATDSIGAVPLAWEAVREVLDAELDKGHARQPFLAGGVSFCGLVPLRTAPFRVVCMLGMNDGVFPRQDRNRSINLIRQQPRLGDSSARDDDRLLLLQWLLAARDVFYLSYTGQDTSSGEALAPATAVAELLDFVARNQFAGMPRKDALTALVTRQPMQPFSPRYFQTDSATALANRTDRRADARVFTFRGGWRPGVDALFGPRIALAGLVDGSRAPLTPVDAIGLDELKRFFDHPARYFLRSVLLLELDLEIDQAEASDVEPLALDPLEVHQLRERLFALARRSGSLPATPPALVRAQGMLPPPPLDLDAYRTLAAELNQLLPFAAGAPSAAPPVSVSIDVLLPSGMRVVGRLGDVYAHGLRRVDARRLGARPLLGHWLDLLALAARGEPAQLICCGLDKDGGLDLRVGTVDPETALSRLDALVGLYLEGLQRPLCFMPDLGLSYLTLCAGPKGSDPDAALEKINARLVNTERPSWEAGDPWFAPLLQPAPAPLGRSAADCEFCQLAGQILGPMTDTLLTQSDAEGWLAQSNDFSGDGP